MNQITADLDRQQMMIERMRAQDEARIRGMQERREDAAIAGLGKEILKEEIKPWQEQQD